MKKRVRVYKPGGQTNQPTQEQIVNYIAQRMSADDYDGDTDALKDELAQAGIQDETADEYISNVSDELGLNNQSQTVDNEQLAAEQEQQAADEEQALLEQQEAADEARQAQLAAMYDTNIDMSTTEDTPEDEENYMRQGGSKLSKRSFIKEYTKLAKMGQGGNTPSPGSNDVLNGRESHVKGFLGAVKNTATEAAMREEAENRFNSAYGAPQVGAFQNGGIQQEQVDIENPMHHIGAYATGIHDIFDNPQVGTNIDFNKEQFGGFTDTDSGLYKFIGGGDNESADEEYQDSDIDFNQEQYQMGGFRMPKRSGRQYAQAVSSPYYTATGERAVAPNLAGRQVSSVKVTDRGVFGRPKAYTVNYGNPNTSPAGTTQQIKMPTEDEAKKLDAKYAAQERRSGNRQPVADMMMRSGIPGIKQLGARMTRSGAIPEIPQGEQPTNSVPAVQAPASNEPYYPPMDARAQRREARDDSRLNRFLGNTEGVDVFNDPKEIARLQQNNPDFKPLAKAKAEAKVEDKKEELDVIDKAKEKINAVINPALQGEKVQAAIDNNTAGGLNRKALNYDYANDPEAKAFQNKYPNFGGNNEEFWTDQQPLGKNQYSPEKAAKMKELGLNPDIYGHHYLYQHPDKFKEYGGPIDYTEYAYGGDIAVPELHKYQMDGQVGFDPNANNMNFSNLQGFFDKPPTKDVAGNAIQSTLTESMQPKNITIDPNQPNKEAVTDQPDNLSQDYNINKDKGGKAKLISKIGQGIGMGINVGLDINDQINARKQENQMLADTTAAESNYGISNEDDRGTYDPNSGLFRPDQMGSNAVVKYGGGIYATGGNTEDEDEDTQYMTQEEIDDFIANGGELEYL
jgi:hypothetical protein